MEARFKGVSEICLIEINSQNIEPKAFIIEKMCVFKYREWLYTKLIIEASGGWPGSDFYLNFRI